MCLANYNRACRLAPGCFSSAYAILDKCYFVHVVQGECVMQNMSEVARLKEQLDAECEAARRAMYGYAEVAKHERITKRMEGIGDVHKKLIEEVGEIEAAEILVRAMDSL